jgi:hypothetical protein
LSGREWFLDGILGENSIVVAKGKKERSLFGVRELAPAFGLGTVCGEESGGKPPHSKTGSSIHGQRLL